VPTAAVIPAPLTYMDIVAIKTLAVGLEGRDRVAAPEPPECL